MTTLNQENQNHEEQEFNYVRDYPELAEKYCFEKKCLTQNKSKINFVVSHGHCTDGFMSATVVRKWLQEQGVDLTTVEFYNGYYGNDFSNLPEKMRDKYVIVCDFSFKKDLFNEMLETTKGNILMLDHHKTAQTDLNDIDEQYVTFDMNHSGAFITWTYFYGFTEIPKAILYVEDNDIWNKALPHTNEFTAYIFSKDFDFDQYEQFFDENYLSDIVFPNGHGMVVQNEIHVNNICKKVVPCFIKLDKVMVKRKETKSEHVTRYYFVACVNIGGSGTLKSDVGNRLVTIYKNANMSMIYAHNLHNGTTNISYRSMNDRSDTTCIATLSGGGGHRNASACSIPHVVNNPPGQVLDSQRAYWLLDGLYVITVNNKKYIVLNSANMHNSMCQYLMQERYFGDEKHRNTDRYRENLPGYQEGMFCMRNRMNDDKLNEYYHGAVVWRYDGLQKKYKMTVKYLPGFVQRVKDGINARNNNTYPNLPDDHKIMITEKRDNVIVFHFSDVYEYESVLGFEYEQELVC